MLLCLSAGCNILNNEEQDETTDVTTSATDDTSDGTSSSDTDTTADETDDSSTTTDGKTESTDSGSSSTDTTSDDVYDGYFEGEAVGVDVKCASGTKNACKISGTTLTFSGITSDSVYTISGNLKGNIVIDVSDDYEFELELIGLSLVSANEAPIKILSGDKVTVSAKKNTENYIYDTREAVDENDENAIKGAIYSEVDLQISGKGQLTVVSENNNGIHTKDDLEVKNLTLTVTCNDNALKGNDSVDITGASLTLISKKGDGIKTSNSDISSKGNQRGAVSITDSALTIYAACDGIDSSYDAIVNGESTVLNIYTDKYSEYSEEVTAAASDEYYIRYTGTSYYFSVRYSNSDTDYEWVDAEYHSSASGGRTRYYYFSFPKKSDYSKLQIYVYKSEADQKQKTEYYVSSEPMTLNDSYDTVAISSRYGGASFSWTNYTTSIQQGGGPGGMGGGPGGMGDGNSDKGDHSTKGIKAANEIIINNGTVNIKSYDDSLHADNEGTLENGEAALGNITVNNGSVTLYSNDDGIHAENAVYIKGGSIDITNSYEGIEGSTVAVSGGSISVYAKDDGFNSTATSNRGITLSGGYVYIYCTGDGMDSNSKTSYEGISFEGGDAVIIANSGMNSAIDTERGYSYTKGSIVAIMPRSGMTSEATHCKNFSSVGTTKTLTLTQNSILTISGDMNKKITMPCSISSANVIILNKGISVSN